MRLTRFQQTVSADRFRNANDIINILSNRLAINEKRLCAGSAREGVRLSFNFTPWYVPNLPLKRRYLDNYASGLKTGTGRETTGMNVCQNGDEWQQEFYAIIECKKAFTEISAFLIAILIRSCLNF